MKTFSLIFTDIFSENGSKNRCPPFSNFWARPYHTVLACYIFDDYWICRVLVKIYKNIFGGFIPHTPPLNTALVNNMADVPMFSATAPRAWSADLYDLSRNAYRNNDQQVKMLHPTAAYYAMF